MTASIALALLGGMVAATSGAAAQPTGAFTGTADGRLYAVDFTPVPGVAFDQLVDAGAGVAQAQVSSLGLSAAFASNAYPGGTVILVPGLVAGLTAGQTGGAVPPAPDYPLIASSTYPLRPTQRVEAGSVVLQATSATTASQASGTDGVNRAESQVSQDPLTGAVVVRSETTISSLRLSDTLSVFGFRSFAEIRRSADGAIRRSNGLEISSLLILGQRVAVTPEMLGPDAGATLAPLLSALAGQGTTVSVFPASQTPDSVTAGGLVIHNDYKPPAEVAAGVERLETEVRFGGNAVRLENRAFNDLPGGGGGIATGTPPGGPGGAPLPPGPTGAVGQPGASPPISADPPAAPSNPTPSGSVASPRSLVGAVLDVSVTRFYPVLVLAACVMVLVVNLFRHFAVRTP